MADGSVLPLCSRVLQSQSAAASPADRQAGLQLLEAVKARSAARRRPNCYAQTLGPTRPAPLRAHSLSSPPCAGQASEPRLLASAAAQLVGEGQPTETRCDERFPLR